MKAEICLRRVRTSVKQFTVGGLSPEKRRRRYDPAGHKRQAEDEQKGFGPRQYPIASHARLNCWTVSEFTWEGYQAAIDPGLPHLG